MVDFSKSFQFFVLRISQSYNPGIAVTIPVWAPSISLAATLEIDVSFFSSSYLDVSVQRVSPHCWVTGLLPAGLSHSDIRGSILVCKSPRLFAAYHVLLRLQEPRHPPYALYYFLLSYRLPIVSRYAYLISLNYVNERRKSFDLPKNSTRFEPTPESGAVVTNFENRAANTFIRISSRKEVFQPHLPVRLPCYDLAPVIGFTLGRSLRLRTLGTPNSHGLTGGVYKARERIHRAMADARLLANPTSWRRVSASNPN